MSPAVFWSCQGNTRWRHVVMTSDPSLRPHYKRSVCLGVAERFYEQYSLLTWILINKKWLFAIQVKSVRQGKRLFISFNPTMHLLIKYLGSVIVNWTILLKNNFLKPCCGMNTENPLSCQPRKVDFLHTFIYFPPEYLNEPWWKILLLIIPP